MADLTIEAAVERARSLLDSGGIFCASQWPMVRDPLRVLLAERGSMQDQHDLLEEAVCDLAESLAEAGVVPCIGSMNPHEDTLGKALVLVPSAKSGVDRIMNQLGGGEGED